jgi:SAM-dependent methyltransferase
MTLEPGQGRSGRTSGHFAPAGPARSRVYRLLWGCANGLQKASNACLYLAAGLLRRDDLLAASRIRWRDFGLSTDDAGIGLEPWERRLYNDLLRPTDRVLLVGCGTGRDLVGLLELGYNVTGLEQVPELVELARADLARRGIAAEVLSGGVEAVDLGTGYDAVIFSPGVYSWVYQSAARVATLARIRACLSLEGRILISYYGFTPPSPLSARLTRLMARLAGADWRPESGDTFSRDTQVSQVLRYEHSFRPGEVAHECAAADLRVIRDGLIWTPFHYAVAVLAPVAPRE